MKQNSNISSLDDIKFWTFIPDSIIIKGDQISTKGWFSFAQISQVANDSGGNEPQMWTPPLTPANEPIELILPRVFFPNKRADEICARDVVDALSRLFSSKFEGIPEVPKDLPKNTPPSKRKKN
jgi:hypothetical protein